MADLGELVLKLRLDTGTYERDLARQRQLTEQFNSQFGNGMGFSLGAIDTSRAQRSLRGFGSIAQTIVGGAFLQIGANITNTLTNAIGAVASIPGQALGAFQEFEAGLNQLSVVTRSSRDELEGVTDVVKELGIETSKAPADVIAAANALATLGQTPVQIETNLPAVVALSEATRTDLELSADLIAKVGTVFGVSADEAADAITTLRNSSAALPQDVTFLLQQAGAVAATSGTQFNDLAAAFATLRDAGVNARPAATGLRNILQNLTPTTDKAKGALESLNLELAVSAETGEFVGFEQFLTTLQATREEFIANGQGLKAFNEDLQVAFGKPGQAAVLGLLEQFTALDGAFAKNQASLATFDGAAASSAQNLQVGFAGALQLLQGTIDTLLISFGEGLAPVVEAFARVLTTVGNSILRTDGLFEGLVEAANRLRDAILNNPEAIQRLAQAFVDLASSGLNVVIGFFNALSEDPELISSTFELAATSVGTFAQAINSIIGFIGVFGNAIGGLSGALSAAGQIFTSVVNALEVFGAVLLFVNPPIGAIVLAVTNLREVFSFLSAPIQTTIDIFNSFIGVIDRAISRLQAFLGIAREVEPIQLDNVGQAGVAAIGDFAARRHGGPVGPGGSFLVGEAPHIGPELGVFGNKSVLFTQPTILPSPPKGRIFSPEKTKRMLQPAPVTSSAQSNDAALLQEVKQLRQQLGRVRDVMPLLDALAQNMAKDTGQLERDRMFENARWRLGGI